MDFKKIPMDLVQPSPMNPRKTVDEEAIKELAGNIEKQGLIQPITVRPRIIQSALNEEIQEGYEIVCGERRYRAFKLLKEREDVVNLERVAAHRRKNDNFQSIPAIVREMTDEEAFENMIAENLQRQDVDPIEEAFAFSQLIKNGKTVEEIAAKFGKSIRFVQDRCKLNNLIPELMLAVKEDKMSISAAMIISKLDDEEQRTYHSRYAENYQGMTKATAESFVNNLFMNLSRAPWFDSDDQADEEFEGGCECKCSECQYNTANHGCLFWDMKNQDAGKCTNRVKFQAKQLAYLLKLVNDNADDLVKKGQPLEFGKMVIGFDADQYGSDSAIAVKNAFKSECEKRGYEIVNPNSFFSSKCWYDVDDERVAKMKESGEIYRVLYLGGYDMPTLEECNYYIKKNAPDVNCNGSGTPIKVSEIIRDYKIAESTLDAGLLCDGIKAIHEKSVIDAERELYQVEVNLLLSLMLLNNRELCNDLGLGDFTKDEEIHKFVADNPHKALYIIRGWMKRVLGTGFQMADYNAVRCIVKPYVDRLGELWCPDSYKEALTKTRAKYAKKQSKLVAQLKKLGYDLDGNKLPETSEK